MPGQASCQICGTATRLTSALLSSSDPSHGALTSTVFTIVHYFHYMTTSIPDSFNMDELSAALENAPADVDYSVNEKASQLMNDEIWDLAHDEVLRTGKMTDNGPVFHKAMVMQILAKLQQFHTSMGDSVREHGAPECPMPGHETQARFKQLILMLYSMHAGHETQARFKQLSAYLHRLMTVSVDDDRLHAGRVC